MDQDVSLRWIYVHMIEEYARHNGHAWPASRAHRQLASSAPVRIFS